MHFVIILLTDALIKAHRIIYEIYTHYGSQVECKSRSKVSRSRLPQQENVTLSSFYDTVP